MPASHRPNPARRPSLSPPPRRRQRSAAEPSEVEPLSASQLRELERRLADSRDRSRYLLASVLAPRFVLFYDVSQDAFVMNDPRPATLFKRRAAARAVAKLLRSGIEIVPCRVNRAGHLVLRSVTEALRGTRVTRREQPR